MSDTTIHYVAFYPSDWLAGTRGLTAAENGVYTTLIAMMYERAEPLNMDDSRLARLCGLPAASFRKVKKALLDQGKIQSVERGLWNTRVEKELNKARIQIEKATAKGQKGAKARWEKSEQKQYRDDAWALPEQSPSNANQNQNQNQIYGGGGSARTHDADLPDEKNSTHRERLLFAMGADPVSGMTGTGGRQIGRQEDMAHVAAWSELGLTEEEQILVVREVMASKRDGPPSSFKFFNGPMQRLAGAKSAAPLAPQASSDGRARPPPTGVKFDLDAFIAKHPELDK